MFSVEVRYIILGALKTYSCYCIIINRVHVYVGKESGIMCKRSLLGIKPQYEGHRLKSKDQALRGVCLCVPLQ